MPGPAGQSSVDAEANPRYDRKGTDPAIGSYSGLFDNGRRKATGRGEFLADRGVGDVWICGLATDYCAKCTALDAASLGFRTRLVEDACRGVELRPGDVAAALAAVRAAGVRLVRSDGMD